MSNPKLTKLVLVLILVFLSPFSLGLNASDRISQTPETDTIAPPTDTPTDTETLVPPTNTPTSSNTPTPTDTVTPTDSLTPDDSQSPTWDLSMTPTLEIQFPSITPSFTNLPSTGTSTPFVHLKGDFVPNEILVQMSQTDSPREALSKCLPGIALKVQARSDKLQTVLLKVPDNTLAISIGYLRNCPGITAADPNYTFHMDDVIPSDPGWGLQYGLTAIRAPQGWQINTGSSSVIIAIVDTGISLSHPDLSAKLVSGYDFVNGDPVANDDNGHGTHVAGIAAAQTNNGTGIAGVSWGALLMPVKVLDASGSGNEFDVALGIEFATDTGAQIINLSLGSNSPTPTVQAAVDYAYSHGVTVVAAAGNSGGPIEYPARYPHVISVAATDNTNNRASFSSFGPQLDVSAPGVKILSTYLGGGYAYLSGTSMSTPFVSGLAAILRGIPGNGSPDVIAYDMESTALDLGPAGRDNLYGYGLIQMDKAIRRAMPAPNSNSNGSGGAGGSPLGSYSVFPTYIPSTTVTPRINPLFTSTSTSTPTSTSTETSTALPTLSVTDTPLGLETQVPQFTARQNQPLKGTVSLQFWFLPCGGGLLILLGFLVVLRSRRKSFSVHYRLVNLK